MLCVLQYVRNKELESRINARSNDPRAASTPVQTIPELEPLR